MNSQASVAGTPFSEQTLVTGIFGTVTNKRVIYNRSRGWFSGGSREDIALAHVTSVRIDTTRHLLWGILLLLIGLSLLGAQTINGNLAGIGCAAMAVLLLWGSPTVYVNTAGQDRNRASSWPWHRQQAAEFVEAIRQQIAQR
jgi:hypothetical protein